LCRIILPAGGVWENFAGNHRDRGSGSRQRGAQQDFPQHCFANASLDQV
jgi:hypothetical protein